MHPVHFVRPRVRTDIGYDDPSEVVRQRDELLAIVSHDLRNPLGAIDLAAQMLELQHSDPTSQKHLSIIRRAATRMEHLIRDLLDVSSMHAGHFVIDKKLEDLKVLLDEILDAHEPSASEKRIALVRDLRVDGVIAKIDRDRIAQVLSNLLGNSIKFCREGDSITVRCEYDEWCVRFIVEDTGPGIPPEELPRVFEAYWSAKRHEKKGTGLGLHICKGIVEAHNGLIEVKSKPNHATAFTVTLPL